MEQLDYNLLFCLVRGPLARRQGLASTVFCKNRDRFIEGEVFAKFMAKLLNHPKVRPLLSDEHFSVDGTLIEAWASHKSFKPKDGSGGDGRTFMATPARMTRTRARPIPRPSSIAKRPARKQSSATWAMR